MFQVIFGDDVRGVGYASREAAERAITEICEQVWGWDDAHLADFITMRDSYRVVPA